MDNETWIKTNGNTLSLIDLKIKNLIEPNDINSTRIKILVLHIYKRSANQNDHIDGLDTFSPIESKRYKIIVLQRFLCRVSEFSLCRLQSTN